MSNFLRHMQAVSLRIGEGSEARWYHSLVLDFEEGREIVVGAPTEDGYEVPVEAGSAVNAQTPLPDGLAVFATTVVRRDAIPSPCLRLDWPQSVQRVQRRESVRVECAIPVEIRVHSAGREPRSLTGTTIDVSQGGMCFVPAEALTAGDELEVRLHLPDDGTVECEGQVLRVGKHPDAPPDRKHWAAVQFGGLSPTARRDLTRFVFDVQRQQIRRDET